MITITEETIGLESVRACLLGLSDSLRHVGMDKLSDDLRYQGARIASAVASIEKKAGADASAQFAQARQSSANMLNAAMAGIELASKKKPGRKKGWTAREKRTKAFVDSIQTKRP